MAFTIVQTVTDRKWGDNQITRVVDRGTVNVTTGSPIGLLLAITYTTT